MKKMYSFILVLVFLFAVISVAFPFKSTKAAPSSFDPVKRHVSNLKLYPEIEYRNLTIIPVRGPEISERFKMLTLEEAMRKNYLTVKEVDQSGSVNTLSIWNTGGNYVYIMAGEILAGSKQDRVLKEDVLLPPESGKIEVAVFCVEHGRWTYKSDKFYSENKTANISVRQAAKSCKDQSAVWDSVGRTNESVSAEAPTGSLSKSYDAPIVKEKREDFSRKFINIPDKYPEANGVIVLVNDKVLVADLFSDQRVFEKIWPKLADSYIIEAVSRQGRPVTSDISSASKFIRYIQTADIGYIKSAGSGKNVEISSPYITGSGLIKDSNLIHVDVFPKLKECEKPRPVDQIRRNYNNLDDNRITPAPNVRPVYPPND